MITLQILLTIYSIPSTLSSIISRHNNNNHPHIISNINLQCNLYAIWWSISKYFPQDVLYKSWVCMRRDEMRRCSVNFWNKYIFSLFLFPSLYLKLSQQKKCMHLHENCMHSKAMHSKAIFEKNLNKKEMESKPMKFVDSNALLYLHKLANWNAVKQWKGLFSE